MFSHYIYRQQALYTKINTKIIKQNKSKLLINTKSKHKYSILFVVLPSFFLNVMSYLYQATYLWHVKTVSKLVQKYLLYGIILQVIVTMKLKDTKHNMENSASDIFVFFQYIINFTINGLSIVKSMEEQEGIFILWVVVHN